jgi:hypothetical protein
MAVNTHYLIENLLKQATSARTAKGAQEYAQAAYIASLAVLNVSKAMGGDN